MGTLVGPCTYTNPPRKGGLVPVELSDVDSRETHSRVSFRLLTDFDLLEVQLFFVILKSFLPDFRGNFGGGFRTKDE